MNNPRRLLPARFALPLVSLILAFFAVVNRSSGDVVIRPLQTHTSPSLAGFVTSISGDGKIVAGYSDAYFGVWWRRSDLSYYKMNNTTPPLGECESDIYSSGLEFAAYPYGTNGDGSMTVGSTDESLPLPFVWVMDDPPAAYTGTFYYLFADQLAPSVSGVTGVARAISESAAGSEIPYARAVAGRYQLSTEETYDNAGFVSVIDPNDLCSASFSNKVRLRGHTTLKDCEENDFGAYAIGLNGDATVAIGWCDFTYTCGATNISTFFPAAWPIDLSTDLGNSVSPVFVGKGTSPTTDTNAHASGVTAISRDGGQDYSVIV